MAIDPVNGIGPIREGDALEKIKQALELDPYNSLIHSLYAGLLNYDRRFADPCFAYQRHSLARPRLGLFEGLVKASELRGPTHEGCRPSYIRFIGQGPNTDLNGSDKSVSLDLPFFAFDPRRTEAFEGERPANELVGGLRDHD